MRISCFGCRLLVLAALSLVGVLFWGIVGGCGGGTDQYIFLNVRERPSCSPDGRIAVAALGADGNLYIWTVSSAGGDARLLTPRTAAGDDAAGGMHPCYSLHDNGQQIAFSGRRAESQIIYRMSASRGEAGGLVPVTEASIAVAGAGSDRQPSWSPDGTRIIYSSNRPDDNWDIWEVDVATSARAELISDPDPALPRSEERWPVYDPTGTGRIVFESRDPATGGSDIWLREADGTLRRLVGDGTESFADGAPWWSNDGRFVYFHSNRAGDFDIWRVELATGTLTQLTNTADSDGFPVTQPNGERIIFVRGNEVWSMRPDGTDQKRVTRLYQ